MGVTEEPAIRIAGMDDHPFSRYTCPPLTTVAQDYDAISRTAVGSLFQSLEGNVIANKISLFEGKLVMRLSA